MINFSKVRYKNFLSTGQQFIEVDLQKSNTTLVVGENGAGKSTMLDALCFGLFQRAFRNIKKDQLINSLNERECIVEGSEDTMTLVNNYVDQLTIDLDKDKLKQMIKETFIEAQDSDVVAE